MRGRASIALSVSLAMAVIGPAGGAGKAPGPPGGAPRAAGGTGAPAREAVDGALRRAREWLDRLQVDAGRLQDNGVKGKKKVGEILAAYLELLRAEENGEERARILARARGIAAQTRDPSWHNLSTCPEKELRENSMSYFRVLRLMEELGLETESYRRELAAAAPRLAEHVASRGAWQKAVFASYYDHFGLERPPSLVGAEREKGIVARRLPAEDYTGLTAYQLTHQIFAAFDGGRAAEQSRFGPEDLKYLRDVLPVLASAARRAGQVDLLAEILSGMAYLGLRDDPAWREGMAWLVRAQNPDGSWGDYPEAAFGPWADQKLTLHTTQVAIQALAAARAGERRPAPPGDQST